MRVGLKAFRPGAMTRRKLRVHGAACWGVIAYMLAGGAVSVGAQSPFEVQQQLADRGVTITTLYGGVLSGLDGGRGQGGTYSGNLNLQVSLDGARLFGHPD